MKKITLIVLSLFIASILLGQQDFILDTDYSLNFRNVEKDQNGDFCAVFDANTLHEHFWGGLVKFDTDFNYQMFTYNIDSLDIHFKSLLITEDNNYLIGATIGKDIGFPHADSAFLILLLDENLNILNEQYIDLGVSAVYFRIKMIKTPTNKYFAVANCSFDPWVRAYVEISAEGDIINQVIADNAHSLLNLFVNPNDDSGFYVLEKSGIPLHPNQIVKVDTLLNQTITIINSQIGGELYNMSSKATAKWYNDTSYFIYTDDFGENYDRQIEMYRMDSTHQFIAEPVLFGPNDIDDDALFYKGMDFYTPENIYFTSFTWPSMSYVYPYYVAVIDENFELKGMKTYGGGNLYVGYDGILATEDGGCVMVGGCRDITGGDEYDYDGFISFYSLEDIITPATETTNPKDSDYVLFPNPGKDILNIHTARKGVRIEIYNQTAQLVHRQILDKGPYKKVNMTSLPSGVYSVKLIDKEGNVENKQWIKQ